MATSTTIRPSAMLREAAAPVWAATLEHPYLKELLAGKLPRDTFRRYVRQDWLYLEEFTRTAALIAARTANPEIMKRLLAYVGPLVTMEHHFHRKHAAELGLDFDRIDWDMNDTNYAYTRHMISTALAGTTVEAMGALLPCPLVYAHVGAHLSAQPTSPDPMYAEWIAFYAPSSSYAERVRMLEDTFDELAAQSGPDELARATRNFVISSRYEWMFWDAPYRGRDWPV